jgi:hypothetical protein
MNRNKGNKRNLSIFIDDFTDAMAEVLHRKEYRELVTFDEIVHYAMEEKKKDSRIEAFVISVKKNYDPQNENDKLIIIQGFLDKNNRPISLDGKEAESRIVHTRTIDKKLLDILNGAETKMVKL